MFIFHPIGFEGLATILVLVNLFSKLVLQPLTIRDVSAPVSLFRILDWTCCYRLSELCSHIGYFTGEFQASRLIVFAALGAVDQPLASCMLVHFLEIRLTRTYLSDATAVSVVTSIGDESEFSTTFPIRFCLTRVAIIRWTGGIFSWNCSILFITVPQ